jgi:hypothetical protein
MRRSVLCVAGLALAAVVALSWSAPAARAEGGKREPLAARLASRVTFSGVEADPNVPLQEVLDMLAARFDLAFAINEAAFKAEGVEDVKAAHVAEQGIPKMADTRLDTVLRRILARVPAGSGATYLLRADGIEITTGDRLMQEVWGITYAGPLLPLANASFEKRPLEDALRELADATDFTILVDAQAAEKARTPVTARLANVPLDTAVRLLADMADMRSFLVANTLYVTTRTKAAALEKQEKQWREENEQSGPRVGAGRLAPVRGAAGM